jgi:hypothetical protein
MSGRNRSIDEELQFDRNGLELFDFPLVHLGFVNSLAHRYRLSRPGMSFRLRRILWLILATWIPLLVLSVVSGHALGSVVDVPLLHDPAVCARFLLVLPALELAEAIVALSLPIQARQFLVSEIVLQRDRPRFDSAVQEVIRIRSSDREEFAIAILSFVLSLTARLLLFSGDSSSWESHETTRTLAGWWYVLVSLPILFFFLLRWLWIFLLWGWFLFRVSRLELQLTATHPDHAGGLGFLGWGLASFSLILMAVSAVFSSGFFYQILHKNESIDSLKYHVLVFVIIALMVLYAPLLVFVVRMSRCRFSGLLDFSRLVHRYDRRFEEKWIEKKWGETGETLLGSPDIQAMADIATVYGHANDMLLIPFDFKGFAVLVAAALLPMIPLLATAIPLKEILAKLGELLV